MSPAPSPKVKRAAWSMLDFVRRSITAGMNELLFYSATRPAHLHDELKHFLDVYDPEGRYRTKKR